MIHSMAGGKLGSVEYNDFAKVRIIEGEEEGKAFFYITKIIGLKEGDLVVVPVGFANVQTKGKVERIDRAVSSQNSPVSVKRAKYIIKKL